MHTQITQNVKQASEIFEEHASTIRAAIRYHTNDESIMDDIFQDFFLSLVHNPVPHRDQNIKGFIRRALRNDVLDAAAKSKCYHLRNRKYAEMKAIQYEVKTPEEILSHSEEIQQLFTIVESQLLRHEAEAIMRKYQHGKNTGETADEMNISRRSVSCYLCTGLKKLRSYMLPKDQ